MNKLHAITAAVAASLLSAAALAAPSGGSTSTANVLVTNTAANPVKTEIVASTILPTINVARPASAVRTLPVTEAMTPNYMTSFTTHFSNENPTAFTSTHLTIDPVFNFYTGEWVAGAICKFNVVLMVGGTSFPLGVFTMRSAAGEAQSMPLPAIAVPVGAKLRVTGRYYSPVGVLAGCAAYATLHGLIP